MHFKLNNRNPFRSLYTNALAIHCSGTTDAEKARLYAQLYALLKSKLVANERFLTTSPAFAPRCQHWNQQQLQSIRPVRSTRNPWLHFKEQFECALSDSDSTTAISRELGWLTFTTHRDDWLAC